MPNMFSITLEWSAAYLIPVRQTFAKMHIHWWIKIQSNILSQYDKNMIDYKDTDNVPIHNQKYEDNDVLSMYRALTVADYIREKTDLDPGLIKPQEEEIMFRLQITPRRKEERSTDVWRLRFTILITLRHRESRKEEQ